MLYTDISEQFCARLRQVTFTILLVIFLIVAFTEIGNNFVYPHGLRFPASFLPLHVLALHAALHVITSSDNMTSGRLCQLYTSSRYAVDEKVFKVCRTRYKQSTITIF